MEQVLICPNCGTSIDVNNYVNSQVEQKIIEQKQLINKEYEKKINDEIRKFSEQQARLEKERANFETEKKLMNEKVNEEIKERLRKERESIEKNIKKQIESDKEYEIKKLQEELVEKNSKIKENFDLRLKIEKIQQEKEVLAQKISLEKERELNEKLRLEQVRITEDLESRYNLRIKEFEKKLDDQTKLAEEMKRKAEQGSMQLQGEIQELELEHIIKSNFPYDRIEEVKKGVKGADLIHHVLNDFYEECGVIYYESKRTKNFQHEWLRKLKEDNQEQKADILVLATEALPTGKSKYYYEDGVWVCSFNEVKPLIMVLRQSLIEIFKHKLIQRGSQTHKDMLFNYLTSNEFHNQLEAIIIGFQKLQKSYLDEKTRMQKIWKEREKQLDNITRNAVEFYGSLRGIAGQSIQAITSLEDEDTFLLEE